MIQKHKYIGIRINKFNSVLINNKRWGGIIVLFILRSRLTRFCGIYLGFLNSGGVLYATFI